MPFAQRLLIHHGRPCPYCGETMRVPPKGVKGRSHTPRFPTRDHVVPKSVQPGLGTIIVCRQCNGDKANRTLEEWLKVLLDRADRRAETVRDFMKANADKKWTPPRFEAQACAMGG